jgi:error-prone DNA polymerase
VVRGRALRLKEYVELHARSAFSFLAGASVPESLAYGCVACELPAMALLDRNGVYGSARFHLISKTNGIRAHVGAELSVDDTSNISALYYPLLVRNRPGYQNLCRLITKTRLRAPKNTPTAATVSELEEYAGGLVCLTGDEDGPLVHALRQGGKPQARRLLLAVRGRGRDNAIHCIDAASLLKVSHGQPTSGACRDVFASSARQCTAPAHQRRREA